LTGFDRAHCGRIEGAPNAAEQISAFAAYRPLTALTAAFTGHSLGGALATLCAYELLKKYKDQLSPEQVL